MKLRDFIQTQVILPRLRETGVLVVYDPARRYHELCLEMADDHLRVVDASESSIESREAALAGLQELGRSPSPLTGLLVYVPTAAPLNDEARQLDPFALYAAAGRVFPQGDSDDYFNLCLRARADHATEIRRIFQDNPNPDFATIDAVGGGQGWPQLATLLGVESAREILLALLAPAPEQELLLKSQDSWLTEAKQLLHSALGMRLLTRSKSWATIADEVWRYLLFSEFVFDLPDTLPDSLADVPRSPEEARPLVEDLCESMRSDQRTQDRYIQRAEAIEIELNLEQSCEAIQDLGQRDTFPFEERSFFAQAVAALGRDDLDKVKAILDRRHRSVWGKRGENRSQWQVVQSASALIRACGDADRQLPDQVRSMDSLIDFYLSTLRQVDRLQREYEQAANDTTYVDVEGYMGEVIAQTRRTYRRLMDSVQGHFLRQIQATGWPPTGRLANADVFDKVVAPLVQQSGQRVALLLIDALRYELAVELQKELTGDDALDLQPAFAQLPSVTPVGMASLLPGAGQGLRLAVEEGKVVPVLNGQPLVNVTQRMAFLRQLYGQRFAEVKLTDFARGRGVLEPAVELLVIRSNEMDSDFESNPEAATAQIGRTFQQIKGAVHRLRSLNFHHAVIVTDHGFYLNSLGGPGDACAKPPGNWVNVHNRFLLGDGSGDPFSVVAPTQNLGIRGDFNQAATPRSLVSYKTGETYLHGGASLQECVVPVLTVRFRSQAAEAGRAPQVRLDYRRGVARITTRRPVIEVFVEQVDLLSINTPVEILIEAQDRHTNVVGEAVSGGAINPATRTLSLRNGESAQITLKMEMEFEGKFSVKAFDPITHTLYAKLDLTTDYTV